MRRSILSDQSVRKTDFLGSLGNDSLQLCFAGDQCRIRGFPVVLMVEEGWVGTF